MNSVGTLTNIRYTVEGSSNTVSSERLSVLEQWKPVNSYPDYEVSNAGLVRRQNHIIQSFFAGLPRVYLYVDLYKNNVRKHFRVHRLVAIHFILNPEKKREVNHKDGNTIYNNASNLEWCTRQENEAHKRFMSLCPENDITKLRETECYDRFCPHHHKDEPFGTCNALLHKYWMEKLNDNIHEEENHGIIREES